MNINATILDEITKIQEFIKKTAQSDILSIELLRQQKDGRTSMGCTTDRWRE